MKHLPNALTIGRIIVTPICLWLLWKGGFANQAWGATLFILAAITDYYDGKLARDLGVRSRLGQFLDPLADKILVLGGFFLFPFVAPINTGLFSAGAWLAWLAIGAIAARDFAVTVLRSYEEKQGRTLKTLKSAKAKTAWQLTFLISLQVFLVFSKVEEVAPGSFGTAFSGFFRAVLESPFSLVFLLVTAAITVWTGAQYFLHREQEVL
ncbi:MAG: CDP-alcohol phosphatidyltransferase family protein [Bacteroidota bacterium]